MQGENIGLQSRRSQIGSRNRCSLPAWLELEDGTRFRGISFGDTRQTDGEVVFNTGMVGYVESLTDPSYRGQILALTYPLIGNYGVPKREAGSGRFESNSIQVRGLVVANYSEQYGHWEAACSLGDWLQEEGITGLTGVDTRELTRVLRSRGTMLGRIVLEDREPDPFTVADPNSTDLVAEVSAREVVTLTPTAHRAGLHVIVVDCGCKRSIVRELRARGCRVSLVPYDHDVTSTECDGILISNGPGDPAICTATARHVAKAIARKTPVPIAGICLGSQIMALAAGARTYKLPYGHRGQNQPVQELPEGRCLITSQNHGYAVEAESLPPGWKVWYSNLNDRTVEGIRHDSLPFLAVQFHPEGSPGPKDSVGFFDLFVGLMLHE